MAKDEKKEDAKPEKAVAKAAAKPEVKVDKKPAAKKPAAKKAPAKKEVKADAPAAKDEKAEAPKKKPAAKKAPAKKAPAKKKDELAVKEPKAEAPKKKPAAKKTSVKKEKATEETAPEGEVIETVDEKTDIKVTYTVKPLFGKYSFSGVIVHNPGLQRYINIEPVSIPHTGARHANRPFAKQHMNIVERLINGMMRTGHGTGQKAKMYRVVEEAFDIIEDRTKENPIQIYIDALCNSAPKEEVTRLRYGGINVPKAVDVSASRRLDIALRNVCRGAVQSSHKSRRRLPQSLANEIILASKRDINSYAVGKKEEVERIASSAR
jgi:small subunit ribosomal protein S7